MGATKGGQSTLPRCLQTQLLVTLKNGEDRQRIVVNPIDYPVLAFEYLADPLLADFRHDPPDPRHCCQICHPIDQFRNH